MAKKWTKALFTLALTGAAIGGAIAYKKYNDEHENEFDDNFEDEDFDLDANLEDTSNREYVTLNIHQETTEEVSPEAEAAAEADASDVDVADDEATE